MKNLDTIELKIYKDVYTYDEEESTPFIGFDVIINGEPVKHFSDYGAFLFHSKDCRTWWEKQDNTTTGKYSGFYPFTCSCGEAGCSGIWEGVFTKHRGWSVEWRVLKVVGYSNFLQKTFYNFHRKEYECEIKKVWKWLKDNKDMSYDYHGEMRMVGDDLSYWYSEDSHLKDEIVWLDSL